MNRYLIALTLVVSSLSYTFAQSRSIGISASPQLEWFGLDGKTVYSLAVYGGTLYAGTDDGVYSRWLLHPDSSWAPIGLQGKKVKAVYPHNIGPIGWGITAGVEPDRAHGDSVLTYCSFPGDRNWTPSDSGIDHQRVYSIKTIDGFPDPRICGETFAGGSTHVYRRGLSGAWKKVFDGVGSVNTLRVSLLKPSVWVGGETMIFAAYIARSTDKGTTWQVTYPDMHGDNACNSIAIHPQYPDIVYAGMEGSVIKTTDGGKTWDFTGLQGTPNYFYGLAIDWQNPKHIYAGGTPMGNTFRMYESLDGGDKWYEVQAPAAVKGISALVTDELNSNVVYIGTLGSGVWRYRSKVVRVEEEKPMPSGFALEQNYPNPFNPTTIITYRLSSYSYARLAVHDVLGREVAKLVDGKVEAGKHSVQFNASGLASGVYMYRLIVLGRNNHLWMESRKMILAH